MSMFLVGVKNIFFNLKNHIFVRSNKLVIWSERTQTNKLHLEVVYINHKFERNKNISGIYYECELEEEDILQYLITLRDKYKIFEIVETNYKFKNKQILTKFIITKTDNLLFQKVSI